LGYNTICHRSRYYYSETTIIEKQPDAKSSDIVIPTTEPAPRRYSLRIRKPVDKLDL
jgi:hypothetical protein